MHDPNYQKIYDYSPFLHDTLMRYRNLYVTVLFYLKNYLALYLSKTELQMNCFLNSTQHYYAY